MARIGYVRDFGELLRLSPADGEACHLCDWASSNCSLSKHLESAHWALRVEYEIENDKGLHTYFLSNILSLVNDTV